MHIHLIAPSSCVDPDDVLLAKSACEMIGIQVSLAPHVFAQYRYLAGTIEQRIADLKAACLDPNIDALWCVRGGTGAAQLLPYLGDWIKNKPIVGYSDNTILLNEVVRRGGRSIHAPVFNEICQKNLNPIFSMSLDAQETLALFSDMVAKNQYMTSHYPISTHLAPAQKQPMQPLTGKICGGNLTVLCSVQGTPWAINLTEPSILLIEDVAEPYYRLERLWVQLLQSIDTTQLTAVVMGDFYQCPQKNVPHTLMDIFNEYLLLLNIPLFQANWFGHGEQNRPFWIGKTATIQQSQLII